MSDDKQESAENIPKSEQPESISAVGNQANLLDDIYMDLSVEVGRAKIKISELLELAPGSIIELNQQTDTPLNIYANEKLIAKGHIVSSNGKYSIRII